MVKGEKLTTGVLSNSSMSYEAGDSDYKYLELSKLLCTELEKSRSEWPLPYPAASLKCKHFHKTNEKDRTGLQRIIIVYCDSRYLGCSCRLPLRTALRRKRKNTLLPYYSQFGKHMKKNSLKWLK
jgi:hypothetical protein